jgi:aldehyde:ferredoxin oxidoreductase
VGRGANELITSYMLTEYGHFPAHCPRLYITTGLLIMMESKPVPNPMSEIFEKLIPMWREWANKVEGAYISTDILHAIAKRFWGSELAVDFSTYEGKALAAKKIQDRMYAKESLILCTFRWPVTHFSHSEDHVGDPTVESQILSAVTGNEMDEEGLYRIGERVFNLQRAVLAREGLGGRESDKVPEFFYTTPLEFDPYNPECLVPGKDGEMISRKGEVLDREKFEGMKDEYYELRGWDIATGLQTKAKLEKLELEDLVEDLAKRGLVVDR